MAPSQPAETPSIETLRADLAAALRWSVRYGWHEAVANHFSVAVDPVGRQFLINPRQRHFSRVRASDLLRSTPMIPQIKMGTVVPKMGTIVHLDELPGNYLSAIAMALHAELGSTHHAIKSAMRRTGASERTVKYWFRGERSPSVSEAAA